MKIKHQIVLGSSLIFVVWILQNFPSPATENCVLELEDGSEVNMGELCNNADPAHQEQSSPNNNSKPDDHRGETSVNTIPPPWNKYCTVTFDQTYDVKYFGAQWFTAQPDPRYLFQQVFGREALLYALTEDGAYQFYVNLSPKQEVPFQSNCNSVLERVSLDPEQRAKSVFDFKDYISVFTDVVVFSDKTLSERICTLEKGTIVATTQGKYGYVGRATESDRVYKYYLNALSPQCGGKELGFVRAPRFAEISKKRVEIIPIGIIKKEAQ